MEQRPLARACTIERPNESRCRITIVVEAGMSCVGLLATASARVRRSAAAAAGAGGTDNYASAAATRRHARQTVAAQARKRSCRWVRGAAVAGRGEWVWKRMSEQSPSQPPMSIQRAARRRRTRSALPVTTASGGERCTSGRVCRKTISAPKQRRCHTQEHTLRRNPTREWKGAEACPQLCARYIRQVTARQFAHVHTRARNQIGRLFDVFAVLYRSLSMCLQA
jgi:hypothetical protein